LGKIHLNPETEFWVYIAKGVAEGGSTSAFVLPMIGTK
jgi:hypothetical protein